MAEAEKQEKGVGLVPEKLEYPRVFFSDDKARLEEYKERIKRYGEKPRKSLDVLGFNDGIITGSNCFANVEFASGTLALPGEVEHALRIYRGYFSGKYIDSGLTVRTAGDSEFRENDFIAKNLVRKIKHRTGKMPTPKIPARVSLRGLKLKENDDSYYGLAYLLGEQTEIIFAGELSTENHGRKFLRTDEKGIPIFLSDKEIAELSAEGQKLLRVFYARDSGLSRFDVYAGAGLDSRCERLADSVAGGRVAEKSALGAAQKI